MLFAVSSTTALPSLRYCLFVPPILRRKRMAVFIHGRWLTRWRAIAGETRYTNQRSHMA